jgi:hypothetical protein
VCSPACGKVAHRPHAFRGVDSDDRHTGICVGGYLCRHLRFLARLAERFGRERYDGVNFYNFTLPVMTMAVYGTGYIARMTRASMVEVMSQQYIRTARLKGLSFGAVVLEACVAQRLDCAVHRHHAADLCC